MYQYRQASSVMSVSFSFRRTDPGIACSRSARSCSGRVIRSAGSLPAATVLEERDRLRNPADRLEDDERLQPIIGEVNDEIARLLGLNTSLQLRLTTTDSDGVLEAIVPHFITAHGYTVPSRRQGSGLISLQSLFLLLHFGQKRIEDGENFCMALEEPELHLPPAAQRRVSWLGCNRFRRKQSSPRTRRWWRDIVKRTRCSLSAMTAVISARIPMLERPLGTECPECNPQAVPAKPHRSCRGDDERVSARTGRKAGFRLAWVADARRRNGQGCGNTMCFRSAGRRGPYRRCADQGDVRRFSARRIPGFARL